jgi:RNA polymerase sigma factor (sigma-70 family)
VQVLEGQPAVGDPRYVRLVQRLDRSLCGLAYRVLGDRGHAEEVVQDSFVKLARDPVLERPDEEVTAWLRRVTLNGAFNRARGERRARERLARAARLEPVREEASPLQAVLDGEERARIRAALDRLPERQRAVLLLRHTGCSYAEVAAALEVAVGSVGVLLARAEHALRRAYEDVTSGEGEGGL